MALGWVFSLDCHESIQLSESIATQMLHKIRKNKHHHSYGFPSMNEMFVTRPKKKQHVFSDEKLTSTKIKNKAPGLPMRWRSPYDQNDAISAHRKFDMFHNKHLY